MSPAEAVRLVFNDTRVAEICGIDRTQPIRWRRPRERGGTGGMVPMNHARKLYLEAVKLGEPLTAEDLLIGRAKPSNDNTTSDTVNNIEVGPALQDQPRENAR